MLLLATSVYFYTCGKKRAQTPEQRLDTWAVRRCSFVCRLVLFNFGWEKSCHSSAVGSEVSNCYCYSYRCCVAKCYQSPPSDRPPYGKLVIGDHVSCKWRKWERIWPFISWPCADNPGLQFAAVGNFMLHALLALFSCFCKYYYYRKGHLPFQFR